MVLVAPAGYGKTMLAAEWVESAERCAWYRATPGSADLAAFSVGLAEAVGRIVPGAGQRLQQRLRLDEAPDVAAGPLGELLAEDLAAWPENAWLVLDDYHLLTGSAAVEEFVGVLVEGAPLRLLVATRRPPSWLSARKLLYGEVLQLSRDQLAMTEEEAACVLEGHSEEAVRTLTERAQGWPAVLGLAALSAPLELPHGDVSGTLYRYFAEEVFRNEPPEVRDVMLRAAVVRTIDERMPGDLLGEGAREALSRLGEESLLHDLPGGATSFHPLLRDFLVRKLEREDPELARELRESAIGAARATGSFDDAFELAAEAGWLDQAAAVAAEAAPSLLDAGRVETLARWLSTCGGASLDEPPLVLARAEIAIRSGRASEAADLAHALARDVAPADALAARTWLLAGRAYHLLSREEEALACHLAARDAASDDQERGRALWGATVSAAQLESDLLEELVAELEAVATGDVDTRLQLASAHAFLASRRRTLAGLWGRFEALLDLASHARDPMVGASFFIGAAYVNLSRAEYRLALQLAERALLLGEEFRLGDVKRSFALCYRAGAEIGLRRFAEAERTLAEMTRLGAARTRSLVSEHRILRLKLALSRGNPVEALDLADAERGEAEAPSSIGEQAGLVALAAAATGDVERCEEEAAKARDVTASIEAHYHARFASLVSQSELGAGEGSAREAVDLLADAAAGEMLDPFVVAYRAYPPLLDLVAGDPFSRDVARAVLTAARDRVLARRVGIDVEAADGGLPLPSRLGSLTPREREVLELVADGLSNAEIAKRLFISEKTAKVHVHHIFEKLGVASRLQAALAARELLPEPAQPS